MKLIESEVVNSTRESAYAKLHLIAPCPPAIVNGEPKERLIATLTVDGTEKQIEKAIFRDAILGLPTFVPKEGLECQATFKQSEGEDADGKPRTYLNLIGLAIKGA
jgi:hypothetical protein